MAKSQQLNFTQSLKLTANTISPTETSNTRVIFTAGANDSVVKALQAVSNETANARVLNIYINDGVTDIYIGSVNVPVNSGFNGTVSNVDLLSGTLFPGLPYDSQGKRVLPLPAGYKVLVSSQSTLASGKTIYISCLAEDY